MKNMRNLSSFVKGDKGMSIVMLFVCVLVIGTLVTIVYHVVERPRRIANVPKGLDQLIKQLDKTIDSVKEKTKVESLNFEITQEAEAQDENELSLSGVLWSGKNSLAIINKKIVGLGDRVSDCWVTDIEEDRVTLRCREEGEKVIRCY